MVKKILSICAAVLMLCSCSVSNVLFYKDNYVPVEGRLNDQFIGLGYADIVRANGAPTREASDGMGGIIYVYEESITEYSAYSREGVRNVPLYSDAVAMTYRLYTEFYVDPDGMCYLVRSNRVEADGRVFSPARTIIISAAAAGILIPALLSVFFL